MSRSFFIFIRVHIKEIIVATISFVVFGVALSFSSQLISLWSNHSIGIQMTEVQKGMQAELQNVSLQREQIISSGVLASALKRGNPLELLAIAQTEEKKRNLDFVVVTDKDGFVLARSQLPTQIGDNFFLTSAYGQLLAKDETKAITVVERGPRVPLIFVSTSQIFDKGAPIGGITVGYSLYNSYATHFQEKYLQKGGQIVFYTSQEGIVGDSLNNKDVSQLIGTYFSLGSDLATQNLDSISKEIKIGNDYYIVRNVTFSGIEKSPGGAFILFPTQHSLYSLFFAGGITLLFILLLYLLKFSGHHKHRIKFFLGISISIFIVVYFATLIKLDNSAVGLKKHPILFIIRLLNLCQRQM